MKVTLTELRPGALCARLCFATVVTVGAVACAPGPESSRREGQKVEEMRSGCATGDRARAACPESHSGRRNGEGTLRSLAPMGLDATVREAADQSHADPQASESGAAE